MDIIFFPFKCSNSLELGDGRSWETLVGCLSYVNTDCRLRWFSFQKDSVWVLFEELYKVWHRQPSDHFHVDNLIIYDLNIISCWNNPYCLCWYVMAVFVVCCILFQRHAPVYIDSSAGAVYSFYYRREVLQHCFLCHNKKRCFRHWSHIT